MLFAMSGELERLIHDALQRCRARRHALRTTDLLIAQSEQFIRYVESRQHGETQRVGGRRRFCRQLHSAIDKARQLLHIGGLERRLNGITLAVDLDVDDAGFRHLQIQRVELLEHV